MIRDEMMWIIEVNEKNLKSHMQAEYEQLI